MTIFSCPPVVLTANRCEFSSVGSASAAGSGSATGSSGSAATGLVQIQLLVATSGSDSATGSGSDSATGSGSDSATGSGSDSATGSTSTTGFGSGSDNFIYQMSELKTRIEFRSQLHQLLLFQIIQA